MMELWVWRNELSFRSIMVLLKLRPLPLFVPIFHYSSIMSFGCVRAFGGTSKETDRFLGRRTACALQICKTIEKGDATMNLVTYSHVIGNASSGYSHVPFGEGVWVKFHCATRLVNFSYGLIFALSREMKQLLLTLFP